MLHPDLRELAREKRQTYERITQAMNDARDRGDIEERNWFEQGKNRRRGI